MFNTSKPFYKSKTILAAIVAIIMMLANLFDIGITEDQISELVSQVVALIASVLAIFGRIKADSSVTIK